MGFEKRKLFGEILVGRCYVGESDIFKALDKQKTTMSHQRIGEILVSMGRISPTRIAPILADQLGLGLVSAHSLENIPAEVLAEVDVGVAVLYRIIPIRKEGEVLVVASADPEAIAEKFEQLTGKKIAWVVANKESISEALPKCYPLAVKATLKEVISHLELVDSLPKQEMIKEVEPEPVPDGLTLEELWRELQHLKERVVELERSDNYHHAVFG